MTAADPWFHGLEVSKQAATREALKSSGPQNVLRKIKHDKATTVVGLLLW